MTFLQPLGLLGLLSLPVIVLLHLLYERNRRAVVPSLGLWRWLEREVRGPRMRLPPITPVLLAQLAAAALLSLALSRPRLDFLAGPASLQRLILVVDTSTSMSATDVAPSRMGWAQARATQLLAGLGAHDSAALIAANARPRLMADTQQAGLSGLLTEVAGLAPAGVGQNWAGSLALASAAALPERDNRIVVITDGAFAFPETLAAARYPARLEWVRVGGPQPNQAVVAFAARPTGSGGVQVFARLANFSDRAAERTVTLKAAGEVFDSHSVQLSASGTLGQVWTLPPNAGRVELELSPADVLAADDRAALGLLEAQSVEAVLVAADPAADEAAAITRALGSIQGLSLQVLPPADYSPFQAHELTVFDGWLPDVWPQGGVLVFDPPQGSSLLPVSGSGPAGSVGPAPGIALLKDVDLEHVIFGATAALDAPAWLAPALSDSDGLGLAWSGVSGGSRVVVFAFALAESNITRRSAFPILVANAAAEVLPPALPASIWPGDPLALPSPDLLADVTITDPAGEAYRFGPDRPRVFEATNRPGLYRLEGTLASGRAWQAVVGANAGAIEESDLRLTAEPRFADQSGRSSAGPSDGLELWPLLAALFAAALLVEARLAWR